MPILFRRSALAVVAALALAVAGLLVYGRFIEPRLIHVSPGVGTLKGMRIFSPPEISILRVAF